MKRMILFFLIAALLLMSAALADSPYDSADTPLTLFAVNVGKGDALLLNCGGETYLIDAGKQEHWGELSRALTALQVSRLQGVILTHTDKDHAGGLLPLALSSIEVDAWYAPAHFTGKASKHPAVEAADLRGQDVIFLQPGDALPLGTGQLTVLGPMQYSELENCNSLVLLAEAGGGRMLLTGDMEFPEEEDLLSAGMIPPCEVIKIANHGEEDATSDGLLRAVQPKVAIISTNTAEEPDTPSNRVMQLLNAANVKVFQTQEADSGVLVTIDEGEVTANLMNYGDFPALQTAVVIESVDNRDDHILLRNTGKKDVDATGWYIVSERGSQIFVLPAGTVIKAGAALDISSLSSDAPGDLVWPDKKVWHKSKEDAACLYDVYGREIDRHE